MTEKKTFIPSELKQMEECYTYLSGLGYPPQLAMNLLYLSTEAQKLNLQTKMLINAENEGINVDQIAHRVIELLEMQGAENGGNSTS